MITYWLRGEQLCEPRPLDYQEMIEMANRYNGHTGEFWSERRCPPLAAFLWFPFFFQCILRVSVTSRVGGETGGGNSGNRIDGCME
ncbi:hypothetical protein VTN77DRAFT_1031 [Rasamsonia byssochlamydoides]|uniref:uncharacterized protein n=1 Tax=Rasamsonia byssochlamydoides TaxID=89139 RepID=UPI003742D28B